MKYIIVFGDGMADESMDVLGGKTPLEAAEKPAVDELAKKHNIDPKYKHIIFTSGKQDLATLTGDLLKRNRDILP